MQIVRVRIGKSEDAQAASDVLRRSITELCHADHEGLPERIAAWLENKTPESLALWINSPNLRLVLSEYDSRIAAVGAASKDGEILLNYVDPVWRFQGLSRAILSNLEDWIADQGLLVAKLTSTRTALPFYLAAGYDHNGPPDIWQGMTGFPLIKGLKSRN